MTSSHKAAGRANFVMSISRMFRSDPPPIDARPTCSLFHGHPADQWVQIMSGITSGAEFCSTIRRSGPNLAAQVSRPNLTAQVSQPKSHSPSLTAQVFLFVMIAAPPAYAGALCQEPTEQ